MKSFWISSEFEGELTGLAIELQPGSEFYKSTKNKHSNSVSLLFFLKYVLPHKWTIVQLLFGTVIVMLLGYLTPIISQAVVDYGILGKNMRFIFLMMVMQLAIILSNTLIAFVQSWLSLHMNTLINVNLIFDYLKKLSLMPISFFEVRSMGDILQRIGDHSRIKDFLMNDFVNIVFAASTFLVFTSILAIYHWKILCIFMVGNLVYVLWVLMFMKYRRELDMKVFRQSAILQNNLVQFIQGMQEIKINGIERHKCWEWMHIQASLYRLGRRSLSIGQIQSAGILMFSSTTSTVISYIAAEKVVSGEMTLGMMMSLSFIIGQISGPISAFIGFIQNYQDAKISLERLNDLHSQKDEWQEDNGRIKSIPLNKDIHIENMSFSYNGKDRSNVLRNINIEIPYGKVTAIVGASGCGKTTLVKLLQGLYQPTTGKIIIGNVPLDEFSLRSWRNLFGTVMQDGYIFSDTIRNNIIISDENVDEERLKQSVELVNLTNFIDNLPNRYNTKIGNDGMGLSQGQKQRILLARAIYKNPKFLFLDEATNALDSQNESEIVSRLNLFFKKRTVVIVAHRLNTIKQADNIIVINNGTVAEQGTHKDLLNGNGLYYKLIKAQLDGVGQL